MLNQYRLLSDVERVPKDCGGLYFFRLRFPSDFELGIDWSTNANRDIGKILSISRWYFLKASELATPLALEGELVETIKAPHLQSRFKVAANRTAASDSVSLFEEALRAASGNDHRLQAVLRAMRMFFSQLPIAYVGMASKQSLYDRLYQHLNDTTGFSTRIRQRELGWNDFLFFAIELPEFSSTDTRSLEKLFQTLARPAFSLT